MKVLTQIQRKFDAIVFGVAEGEAVAVSDYCWALLPYAVAILAVIIVSKATLL